MKIRIRVRIRVRVSIRVRSRGLPNHRCHLPYILNYLSIHFPTSANAGIHNRVGGKGKGRWGDGWRALIHPYTHRQYAHTTMHPCTL